MSTQNLEVLDTTLQKTHQWIDSISEATHLDRHTSYQALRGVLQALRDRLPQDEAAHFSAQLPLLVRGIFYEGYRPSAVPVPLSRREFLDRVDSKIVANRSVDVLAVTRQVLGVMAELLSEGEMDKLALVLPKEFQNLFPLKGAAVN
jgi:uncharacterized protein (DUF2267 family)